MTQPILREEWEDRVHDGHFVDKLYDFSPKSKVADDIADWWFARFQTQLEILAGAVEKKEESMINPDTGMEYYLPKNIGDTNGFNRGLSTASSLIRTFSKELN